MLHLLLAYVYTVHCTSTTIISDTILNDLVRRVLDEVSEQNINDSAQFKKIKTINFSRACFNVRIIMGNTALFK